MKRKMPLPHYLEIKQYVMKRVASGAWPIDHRVPSENEFVDLLGISRMTVNRAMRELTAEGHLRRIPGSGTFVADPRPQVELLELRNIAEEIRDRGHRHDCVVQLLRAETAEEPIVSALMIRPGARVFHSVVVHCDNGMPVQLEDRYVNPRLVPDYLSIDPTVTTPNAYLMEVVPSPEVEHVIEAILPDAAARKLLRITASEPCILLHRRTWSTIGIVSRAFLTHPSSRYRLGARFATARSPASPFIAEPLAAKGANDQRVVADRRSATPSPWPWPPTSLHW